MRLNRMYKEPQNYVDYREERETTAVRAPGNTELPAEELRKKEKETHRLRFHS